nr:MAG TPA: hypothetical protein [Caudoviricetes sp.]
MEKTVTKREVLDGLITLAETGECTLAAEDIKTFAEKEIASMDKRAAADKKRREAKAAESDEITEAVYEVLTDEPMSAEEILEKLDMDMPKSKLIPKLTKLVKFERAVKSKKRYKNDEGKSAEKTMYARA